jgi:hypothetical protein
VLSTGTPPDWASVDIAVPRPSGRLPGVSMAGFSQCAHALVDIAMVAHPGLGVGEVLQIRLEPAAAAAVFGEPTELSGTVVSLEDVWDGDAGRAPPPALPARAGTSTSPTYTARSRPLPG